MKWSRARRNIVISVIVAAITIAAMIHPSIPQRIGAILVYDQRPKDWIITDRYIHDIKALPEFLKNDSSRIYIGKKGSYTKGKVVYLNVNDYHADIVLHEAIHVLDNRYKITEGSAYKKCLLKDHYRIDDRLDEVFVTTMMFQYRHRKRMKKAFPHTYQFQCHIISKAQQKRQ